MSCGRYSSREAIVAAAVLMILAPLLGGMRGVTLSALVQFLPLVLIFAGVLGGLFAFGIIGLFVGPVVLAVTYTLLVAWVTDRDARLFLPVARSAPAIVTVKARALETDEPQTLELLWDEVSLGSQPMVAAWTDYRFHVPAERVHAGTNVLALQFSRAPIYHRVRGSGPREVRPAALASITLHRAP